TTLLVGDNHVHTHEIDRAADRLLRALGLRLLLRWLLRGRLLGRRLLRWRLLRRLTGWWLRRRRLPRSGRGRAQNDRQNAGAERGGNLHMGSDGRGGPPAARPAGFEGRGGGGTRGGSAGV